MDAAEIQARIEQIAGLADDPEAAHVEEDNLYLGVLGAIAAGAADPAGLAREALKANELEYDRWYA